MNDFEEGLRNRRRILGDAWVAESLGAADALNAEFQTLITRHAWFDVWNRKHVTALDDRTRRLLVLAMTLGLGRYEEFSLHAKACLLSQDVSRLTVDDLREVVMQAAVYCGVPAANTAMHALKAVLKQVDQTPPSLAVNVRGTIKPNIPTIVFSHALGYDQSMWADVISLLGDTHAVVTYDHRGQGKSARTNADFSIDALVDDAASVILNHVFAKGGGPVCFVGLSMGGMVAQGLAARYPHLVKRMVIANSALRYDETARALWRSRIDTVSRQGMSAVVEMALARWFGASFREQNPPLMSRVTQILLANDATDYMRTCSAISKIDFSRTNANITCPALVIAGARDEATPPSLSQDIANSISNATLVSLDAAHISAVEKSHDFAAQIRAHLASNS